MRWFELAENPEVITELYYEVPSLQTIDLHEIALYEERAKMVLRADLNRFADKPPTSWIKRNYNTTYIQLDFLELKTIQITRWSTVNVVDANIGVTEDGNIQLIIISSTCYIQATAQSFRIGTVSAYQQHL